MRSQYRSVVTAYLTNAMILGGLLNRVRKKRLLMILNGFTRASRVGSSMLSGKPSMYRLVELVSFSRSILDLNESEVSGDAGGRSIQASAWAAAYVVPGIL